MFSLKSFFIIALCFVKSNGNESVQTVVSKITIPAQAQPPPVVREELALALSPDQVPFVFKLLSTNSKLANGILPFELQKTCLCNSMKSSEINSLMRTVKSGQTFSSNVNNRYQLSLELNAAQLQQFLTLLLLGNLGTNTVIQTPKATIERIPEMQANMIKQLIQQFITIISSMPNTQLNAATLSDIKNLLATFISTRDAAIVSKIYTLLQQTIPANSANLAPKAIEFLELLNKLGSTVNPVDVNKIIKEIEQISIKSHHEPGFTLFNVTFNIPKNITAVESLLKPIIDNPNNPEVKAIVNSIQNLNLRKYLLQLISLLQLSSINRRANQAQLNEIFLNISRELSSPQGVIDSSQLANALTKIENVVGVTSLPSSQLTTVTSKAKQQLQNFITIVKEKLASSNPIVVKHKKALQLFLDILEGIRPAPGQTNILSRLEEEFVNLFSHFVTPDEQIRYIRMGIEDLTKLQQEAPDQKENIQKLINLAKNYLNQLQTANEQVQHILNRFLLGINSIPTTNVGAKESEFFIKFITELEKPNERSKISPTEIEYLLNLLKTVKPTSAEGSAALQALRPLINQLYILRLPKPGANAELFQLIHKLLTNTNFSNDQQPALNALLSLIKQYQALPLPGLDTTILKSLLLFLSKVKQSVQPQQHLVTEIIPKAQANLINQLVLQFISTISSIPNAQLNPATLAEIKNLLAIFSLTRDATIFSKLYSLLQQAVPANSATATPNLHQYLVILNKLSTTENSNEVNQLLKQIEQISPNSNSKLEVTVIYPTTPISPNNVSVVQNLLKPIIDNVNNPQVVTIVNSIQNANLRTYLLELISFLQMSSITGTTNQEQLNQIYLNIARELSSPQGVIDTSQLASALTQILRVVGVTSLSESSLADIIEKEKQQSRNFIALLKEKLASSNPMLAPYKKALQLLLDILERMQPAPGQTNILSMIEEEISNFFSPFVTPDEQIKYFKLWIEYLAKLQQLAADQKENIQKLINLANNDLNQLRTANAQVQQTLNRFILGINSISTRNVGTKESNFLISLITELERPTTRFQISPFQIQALLNLLNTIKPTTKEGFAALQALATLINQFYVLRVHTLGANTQLIELIYNLLTNLQFASNQQAALNALLTLCQQYLWFPLPGLEATILKSLLLFLSKVQFSIIPQTHLVSENLLNQIMKPIEQGINGLEQKTLHFKSGGGFFNFGPSSSNNQAFHSNSRGILGLGGEFFGL